MSKYLLDKFLYTVDRDPELVERYREDPAGTVEWWEAEMANKLLNVSDAEKSTWLAFTDDERRALAEHDHVTLFGMGAHPFLTLTLFIAMSSATTGLWSTRRPTARRWNTSRCPTPTSPPDGNRAVVRRNPVAP